MRLVPTTVTMNLVCMYHSWHIIFTLNSVYSYCDVKSPSVCRFTAFSQSSIKHNKYALFISLLSLSYLSTLPPRSIRKKPQVSSMMDYSNDCLMNSYQMKETSSNKPSPTVSRESKEPPSVNRDLFARKNAWCRLGGGLNCLCFSSCFYIAWTF